MAFTEKTKIRENFGLGDENRKPGEKLLPPIEYFLQGAVYSWIGNGPSREFKLQNLVGGENFNWKRTPLQPLYELQIAKGHDHELALTEAAKVLGHILKKVLFNDRRVFEINTKEWTNVYKWTGEFIDE